MSGTPHRSLLLTFIAEAHWIGLLPMGGVTAQEVIGDTRHAAASSRELRMLETQGFLRGKGWPKSQRRYTPTRKGLRAATKK